MAARGCHWYLAASSRGSRCSMVPKGASESLAARVSGMDTSPWGAYDLDRAPTGQTCPGYRDNGVSQWTTGRRKPRGLSQAIGEVARHGRINGRDPRRGSVLLSLNGRRRPLLRPSREAHRRPGLVPLGLFSIVSRDIFDNALSLWASFSFFLRAERCANLPSERGMDGSIRVVRRRVSVRGSPASYCGRRVDVTLSG